MRFPSHQSVGKHAELVEKDVLEALCSGAFSQLSAEEVKLILLLGVIYQRSGKPRLTLDACVLSLWLKCLPFTYERPHDVQLYLHEGNCPPVLPSSEHR